MRRTRSEVLSHKVGREADFLWSPGPHHLVTETGSIPFSLPSPRKQIPKVAQSLPSSPAASA